MKRYIKSSFNPKTEEYGGYFIDHYEYDDGTEEFVVDIDLVGDGDEHFFDSESDLITARQGYTAIGTYDLEIIANASVAAAAVS